MTPTEQAWHSARVLHRLPDTPAMRDAFYRGARHAMTAMLDADNDGDQKYKLNDDLRAFARATLEAQSVKEPA